VQLRDWDIGEKEIVESDFGERDFGERDIRETIGTCQIAYLLLIHINIRGVSGCISLSQSWHCWARFLQRHKPYFLQLTEGMTHQSL
jgi:hypothetical protein